MFYELESSFPFIKTQSQFEIKKTDLVHEREDKTYTFLKTKVCCMSKRSMNYKSGKQDLRFRTTWNIKLKTFSIANYFFCVGFSLSFL